MTRVWVEPSERRVEPFGDTPGKLSILHRSLREWQDEAFRLAGLEQVGACTPPCLVVPDTLFCSGEVLADFVKGADGSDAVLVLAPSVFGEQTTPVQPYVHKVEEGWCFEKVRFVSEDASLAWRDAKRVVVDPEEDPLEIPVPKHLVGKAVVQVPRAKRPVLTVHHWVHLLWANQAASSMVLATVPWWRGLPRLIWAVIRAIKISILGPTIPAIRGRGRWLNHWHVLGALNTVGKNCDIHPSAVVEGSRLGDNVTVGAHARVLLSDVGDGAHIMAGAQVETSVVGHQALVCQASGIRSCLLMPEAVASQAWLQLSVLGRRAITTVGSLTMDLNFERPIRVPLDGSMHEVGREVLGAAFGHDVRVGTGVWVAPGRMIPNGVTVVRDPNQVLLGLPDNPKPGSYTIRRGSLVPLHEEE